MNLVNLISIDIVFSTIFRTLIIFLFAFFVLRLLGKRRLSHLTYLDLLLVIALGSAVGDVMIYEESVAKMFASVIAITVVGILIKILNEISSHSKKASFLIAGDARLIIENGKIIKEALSKEDMREEDLMMILREKGFHDIKNIRKAYIEADGELSVMTRFHTRKK